MEAQVFAAEPAVESVCFIPTGSGAQHHEHRYGTRKPLMWWVLTSRSWVEIPIGAFLIQHREGAVLFDTGMDPQIGEPEYINSPIGRFLLRRIFQLNTSPEDSLGRQLEAIDVSPDSVHKAIISHLHFDHVGGITEIPKAELLVSRDEWQRLSEPNPQNDWILREHIEVPGAKWRQIDFEPTDDPVLEAFGECHDVMGDGSLVLLPTPGHTRGSMSLLLRSSNMVPMLFVGDLTYELDLLMNDQFPPLGDKELLRASFAKVRALKQQLPDLLILPSHDPAAATNLARLRESI
jgi:N-acyl homoserine lactone hydrolase